MSSGGDSSALSNASPLVTIAIPTFRRPELLREAVGSALNQRGFDNFEVLVTDNESDPMATEVVESLMQSFQSPRLRYVRNERNLGMTGNWNRGLTEARGSWITLLHDDDLLHPAFLARASVFFEEADLIACKVKVGAEAPDFSEPSSPSTRPEAQPLGLPDLVFANPSPAPGILFRRNRALELQGFDESWYPCADYEFWIRYLDTARGLRVKEPLAFYRVQANESLRVATRIDIVEKAGRLQQALAARLLPGPWSCRFVGRTGIRHLLSSYSKDSAFRQSHEFAAFMNRQGLPMAPWRWTIQLRMSLAKRLLRWCLEGGRP